MNLKNKTMIFFLRIHDNFHYMDESQVYDYGNFKTFEEAETKAKTMVEDFLIDVWKPGMHPDELSALFSMYGDTPLIGSIPMHDYENFSAREYVSSRKHALCEQLEKQHQEKEKDALNEQKD